MQILSVVSQLRTTDLDRSHLKLVDEEDPSIDFVDKGDHFHLYLETDDAAAAADALKTKGVRLAKELHQTAWGTREFAIKDDQGHTAYFGETQREGSR